jgi:tight adherence protein B
MPAINMPFPAILMALTGTLAVAVWGFGDLAAGAALRRSLAARSALGDEADLYGPMVRLDAVIRRTELGRALARRIAASGMRIRVSTFLLLIVVGAVAAIIGIGQWIAPVFGLAAGIAVAMVFFSYLRRREERRKDEFIGQLPELARVLSNATNAGLALRTAIEIAADELPDPARIELGKTADALRLGQPVDQALRDLSERLPSRELGVLVSTLIVSARAGGSLVTALRSIATTLEDRKEIRREVKTIMGEAVVTNWAIGILTVGGLVLTNLIRPGALRAMSENLIGQVILGAAAVAFVLSLIIIRRITRIDV